MKRYVVLSGLLAFCLLLCGCGGGENYDYPWLVDLFGNELDSSVWTVANGTPTVYQSRLVLDGSPGGGDEIRSIEAFSPPQHFTIKGQASAWAPGTSAGFEGWLSVGGVTKHCAIVLAEDHLRMVNEFIPDNPATPEKENVLDIGVAGLQPGQEYTIEIFWSATEVQLVVDGLVRADYDAWPGGFLIPDKPLHVRLAGTSDFADQFSVDRVEAYPPTQ